jgi:acetolactate synthase regulatory subunit
MKIMNHRLAIEFNGVEGAFLRILGMMERRGYHLQACTLKRGPDDVCVVEVTVQSDRPGDLLQRQLERLYNVRKVKIRTPEQPASLRRINVHARA